MKKNKNVPCTEIKTKTVERIRDGKKVFDEEVYVLTRKIKRQKAKQTLKAMGVKHPCQRVYDKNLKDYLPSSLAVHWREYGSQV